jgi:hypothetical protein
VVAVYKNAVMGIYNILMSFALRIRAGNNEG